jgi:hypothetical protein
MEETINTTMDQRNRNLGTRKMKEARSASFVYIIFPSSNEIVKPWFNNVGHSCHLFCILAGQNWDEAEQLFTEEPAGQQWMHP